MQLIIAVRTVVPPKSGSTRWALDRWPLRSVFFDNYYLLKNKKVSYRYKTASKDFELNVSKWRIFWLTPKRHQWPPNCFKKWFLSVMPNKIYTWLASHSHKFSEFFNSIFGGMGAVFPPCRWYFLYWCCEGRHFDIRTLYPSPRAPIDQYIARRSEHEKNFKY